MGQENLYKMNWDNIKTIAQFDGRELEIDTIDADVSQQQSPHNEHPSINFRDVITDLTKESRPTASTSLLIESLIQLLCYVLEDDKKLAQESYQSICEQLNKINLIDNSYSMNEFEEIRSQYQMQIYKIICAVRGEDIPISLPSNGIGDGINNNANNNNSNNKSSSVETCWSRYHREFEEIGFIAGGGFGKVFRARHKLDCIEYAVKQIKIHSTTIKLCHLAEVKTIASLNHPNIVQYKAAWLEPYLLRQKNNNRGQQQRQQQQKRIHNKTHLQIEDNDAILSSSQDQDDRSPVLTEIESIDGTESVKQNRFVHDENGSSSDFIEFERTNDDDNDDDDQQQSNDTSTSSKAICKYSNNQHRLVVSENFCSKPKLAILYIQMSLCQMTLRRWLNERNACRTFEEYYLQFFNKQHEIINHLDIVNDIFCQILSGLNYIHSRNIVHHDIKPSNIFLGIENDCKLIAQLGDFGLACPLQNAHHGIALGTPLYAAPEQLKGKCNPKSDIYSLGIVLLELLLKFNTDMERIRTIESARKGIFPTELNKQSVKLLRSLLSNEKIRPTTKELEEAICVVNLGQNFNGINLSTQQIDMKLKDVKINDLKEELKLSHNKNVNNENEISNLLQEIEIRDKKLNELTKLLAEKDDEIMKLKNMLKKFKYKDDILIKVD